MPKIFFNHQEIPYTLKRSSRRRTVALHVDPSGAVTVLAPQFAWSYFIHRWVRKRIGWIQQKRAYFHEMAQRYPTRAFTHGELFPVWGTEVPLDLLSEPGRRNPSCELHEGRLQIRLNTSAGDSKKAVQRALHEWYARQTEEKYPEFVTKYAHQLGVSPRSIKVANQKSRWGSCSASGRVRLNGGLSAFPEFVLEYVVIHELAHLKAHNHSARFWALVESILPDSKERRKWLRLNSHRYALHETRS